ncbi:LacI family DNA-binding transcriptional regulator [Agrococcus beijingensis]|uniref:LacI family DNA-binding transcriptional regulator n=1 Tax=Agrococcus beijingensis TaxID=3068634 RepID=UPI0027420965|nr:LacI family DNA-binding transcriptional regulator [Agrococcus sp. REN33]
MSSPERRRGGSAPTIYDVAKLAGVNPSTVSRALNSPGRINEKTEAKVRAAARDLRYRLNPMARALPTGRTSTLGLILSDITNPMIAGIVRGAQQAASERGYTLLLAESQESGELEATAVDRMISSVDGLVLAASRLDDERIAQAAEDRPMVLINRAVDDVESVIGDVEPGIDEAVAHLHLLGHRRIVYLSGPQTSWMSRHREAVIRAVAARRGVEIEVLGPNRPTLEMGTEALPRIVATGATAVVAYNDVMAIGLLRAAQQQGLDIPSDLSIVGFDDVFGSDFTSPPLTTVRMPLMVLGELAVRRLLDMLQDDTEPERIEPPVSRLVIRGSSGRARS